ncbi:FAD binding domain-containing protein [Variovorax saccharolyticus]|uniref:FAD binding domain-containing protein n=1 Tax=Variovorax saccharolyticus TaxID=3053516 RepID=UPI002577571B|nr:FAD binding domain-containing protein [Variovorax sp. J31P216]MDM0027441.1 FAD binding domain-containing protein [Variovorax sp. J31P216]
MTTPDRPRAIIAGGSLSGLFAATTLRAVGWDVAVFERSPDALDSRGGGIVLQPDVLAAFRFAGVGHADALGVRSGDRIYLDAEDGVIHRSWMPQTQTSWNMLYGAMRRALPATCIHAGERLVSFKQTGERVTALFASGRLERGDLLIGADGAGSTVRSQLLPGLKPTYAGYVAWRGLVPESALAPAAAARLGSAFVFQQGRDHLVLEYRVPGEDGSVAEGARRWNWVWYRKVPAGLPLTELLTDRDGVAHAFSLPPDALRDAPIAALRRDARQLLAPSLRELVLATEAPFIQAILDLAVRRMVFGRTVLIGDAAFVPRPHTAGSTAKAAADALSLAKAVAPGQRAIDTRLAAWGAEQLNAGAWMGERGISMGNEIMGIA